MSESNKNGLKMVTLSVFTVLLLTLFVLFTFSNRPIEGTILYKSFVPAHFQAASRGSFIWIGDTWTIDVKPDDGSSTVVRIVKEPCWNQLEVGEHWSDATATDCG